MRTFNLKAVTLGLLVSLPALADVRLLGRVSLDDGRENRIFVSNGCRGPRGEQFERIKIRVRRAAAHIDRVRVRYGNGRSEDLLVRQNFNPNSESRWINLRGADRCISAINVQGSTRAPWFLRGPLRLEAVVEVYGYSDDRPDRRRPDRDRDHRDDDR